MAINNRALLYMDLSSAHRRQLWLAFLGRYNDISLTIRIKCVQYTMHFLLNHPELIGDITDTLKLRQGCNSIDIFGWP